MSEKFNTKTFKYFDQAVDNFDNKDWFEKNKELYDLNVRGPFQNLVGRMHDEFKGDLPRINIRPQSISRPLRPKNRAAEKGWVKNFSCITLSQKKTSLFEWNPAIYIQIGQEKEANLIGVGLYMASGRQIRELRDALYNDYSSIHKILNNKKFKSTWGGLAGEMYKRFPKDFDLEHKSAQYIWHKQFYVCQYFNRTQVKKKDFHDQVIKDLKTAMPFIKWVRQAVGIYRPEDQG